MEYATDGGIGQTWRCYFMDGMGSISSSQNACNSSKAGSGTGASTDTNKKQMAIAKLNETTVTKMKDGSKKVHTTMRNSNGDTIASFSYTLKAPVSYAKLKKLKKLQYNFKQISAMLMRTKTSNAASQVVSKARRKVAALQRQRSSGEYDDEALDNAITHAKRIERAAKKRMRHLRQEEAAENNGTVCVSELDEALQNENEMENGEFEMVPGDESGSAAGSEAGTQASSEAEMLEDSEEELRQLMQDLAEAMKELEDEMPEEFSLNDLLEVPDQNMSPEEIEQLKKKHRSEEMREVMEADMKYLKAMFEKLSREQQANAAAISIAANNSSQAPSMAVTSGTGGSGGTGSSGAAPSQASSAGATLEIAGMDMTAPTADMPVVTVEGGQIDVLL